MAPTARLVDVESKVAPIGCAQRLSLQSWKVTLPVSFVSGSLKTAPRVGVSVFTVAASASVFRLGVFGAAFAVVFVVPDESVWFADFALPTTSLILFEPGAV